jgi:hypothetical protein
MARRARVSITLVEHGDDITLHFDGGRVPPIWFSRRADPRGYWVVRDVLDDSDSVEDVPVIGAFAPTWQEQPRRSA